MLSGLIELMDWFNSRNYLIDQNYITWMIIVSQGRRVGVLGVMWSRSRITDTHKTFESRKNTVISCPVTSLYQVHPKSEWWSKQFIEAGENSLLIETMLTLFNYIYIHFSFSLLLHQFDKKCKTKRGCSVWLRFSFILFVLSLVSINPISTSISTNSEPKCCSTT